MAKITYRKAGVDINKANKLIDNIKPIIMSTKRPGWVENIGAFAGFFRPELKGMKNPILVASTDGVGTKLLIAQAANRHFGVGIDLVAMCVNDLVTCGAEPLFFLDYFGCGKLKPGVMTEVIKGVAEGCRRANVALIGGETAELPGMYGENVYDLAGFSVGLVDRDKIIDGSRVKEGDLVLGIQSSGVHSNGYSLVRKVLGKSGLKGALLKEALEPTIMYVRPALDLIRNVDVHGLANITGGGFFDNIIRALPSQKAAIIFKDSWNIHNIFKEVQKRSGLDDKQMYWTFNMGIGMVAILSKKDAWKAKNILLKKYKLSSWVIGEVIKGKRRVELIES